MKDSTTQHLIRQLTQAEFPKLLLEIPDCPKRLFVRGTLPPLDYIYLCVVGSRAASPYGKRTVASLIAGLARSPVAIVSGLALGIDADAHQAALDVGLPTIAIMPSGLDDQVIYPSSHHALARNILARGGALISENEPLFKPMQHSFAQRNRIMAGMSHATLVIEAGEKSGTLITARLALDYNRDVMGIPHDLGRASGVGVNRLLREGATLVRTSEDILEVLGLKSDAPVQGTLPTDLTDIEVAVLSVLLGSITRDELIDQADIGVQQANIALSSLLIRGLITERLGKIERL